MRVGTRFAECAFVRRRVGRGYVRDGGGRRDLVELAGEVAEDEDGGEGEAGGVVGVVGCRVVVAEVGGGLVFYATAFSIAAASAHGRGRGVGVAVVVQA